MLTPEKYQEIFELLQKARDILPPRAAQDAVHLDLSARLLRLQSDVITLQKKGQRKVQRSEKKGAP